MLQAFIITLREGVEAALIVGILSGMWNGMLVAYVGMQPIIATLILMVAGRGVAQLLTGGQIIPIGAPGYLFVVRPGERVATDGEIVLGSSTIDRSVMTGESQPVGEGLRRPALSGTGAAA